MQTVFEQFTEKKKCDWWNADRQNSFESSENSNESLARKTSYLRIVMIIYLFYYCVPSVIQRFRLLLHLDSFSFADARIRLEIIAEHREIIDITLKIQGLLKKSLRLK